MVNMVGFHHDHYAPKANTAAFGEPGHYFRVRWLGGAAAIVSYPCGQSLFRSPDEARGFLDAPGDIGPAARHYLELLREVAI